MQVEGALAFMDDAAGGVDATASPVHRAVLVRRPTPACEARHACALDILQGGAATYAHPFHQFAWGILQGGAATYAHPFHQCAWGILQGRVDVGALRGGG